MLKSHRYFGARGNRSPVHVTAAPQPRTGASRPWRERVCGVLNTQKHSVRFSTHLPRCVKWEWKKVSLGR